MVVREGDNFPLLLQRSSITSSKAQLLNGVCFVLMNLRPFTKLSYYYSVYQAQWNRKQRSTEEEVNSKYYARGQLISTICSECVPSGNGVDK